MLRVTDQPQGVMYLQSGYVAACALTTNGINRILNIFRPGDVFPICWSMGGEYRPVNLVALAATEILRISREEFLATASRDAEIGFAIIDEMCDQFVNYGERLNNLTYSSSYDRIVYLLLHLCNRYGSQTSVGHTINFTATHYFIADATNMARETASNEIARLTRQGLIRRLGRQIVVPDLDALRVLLGADAYIFPSDGLT